MKEHIEKIRKQIEMIKKCDQELKEELKQIDNELTVRKAQRIADGIGE